LANSIFITPGGFSNNGSQIAFPVGSSGVIEIDGLATTSTDGLIVQNTTPATSGATVQISPRLRLGGTAWNSVGLASETNSFFIENLPATNAGTTTATFKIGYVAPNGTVTYPFTVSSGNVVTGAGTFVVGANISLGDRLIGNSGNGTIWNINSAVGDGKANLTNNANTAGIGFDVTTDAFLQVRVRAQNAFATVRALLYDTTSGGSTTISTGVGSVRMSTVNAATNTAWIPLSYAGTTYFVPAFATNAP
jgi:hypothetical protein